MQKRTKIKSSLVRNCCEVNRVFASLFYGNLLTAQFSLSGYNSHKAGL